MEAVTLKKYPRTPHLEGSRLQPGDEDLSQVPFSYIKGKHLVVEEKNRWSQYRHFLQRGGRTAAAKPGPLLNRRLPGATL